MRVYSMSIHLLVCAPIILSVCPSFCPSVCPSVHPHNRNHIVKIAKSIVKSIESQWYNSMKTNIIDKMKKILKRKLH